jgi:hypothetical protein
VSRRRVPRKGLKLSELGQRVRMSMVIVGVPAMFTLADLVAAEAPRVPKPNLNSILWWFASRTLDVGAKAEEAEKVVEGAAVVAKRVPSKLQ